MHPFPRVGTLSLPSRVCVCSPGATDSIWHFINQEVMKIELMLQAMGHSDAGWACADDDSIHVICVGGHPKLKDAE